MSLDVHEFVVTVVLAHQGSVKGRTYLQKVCYFVGKLMNQNLGYEPYYYGPYSEEIASATSDLVIYGVLEETRAHLAGVTQYSYRLDRDNPFVNQLREQKRQDISSVDKATKKVLEMPMVGSVNSLAVAAKVHSILERGATSMTDRELVQAAHTVSYTHLTLPTTERV